MNFIDMNFIDNNFIDNKYFIYYSKSNIIKFLYPQYTKSNNIINKILLYDFNNNIIDEINSINDENEDYINLIKNIINYICVIQNRCIVCFKKLGDSNPRQYCMKSYCPYDQ